MNKFASWVPSLSRNKKHSIFDGDVFLDGIYLPINRLYSLIHFSSDYYLFVLSLYERIHRFIHFKISVLLDTNYGPCYTMPWTFSRAENHWYSLLVITLCKKEREQELSNSVQSISMMTAETYTTLMELPSCKLSAFVFNLLRSIEIAYPVMDKHYLKK